MDNVEGLHRALEIDAGPEDLELEMIEPMY